MLDKFCTFSIPSAAQKRVCAKGKSAEIFNTTVLFIPAASLLNARIEAAQVGVSTLGNIFSTLRLPAKLSSVTSANALSTKVKLGAVLPTLGKLPATSTGLPLSVTEFDMIFPFLFVHQNHNIELVIIKQKAPVGNRCF